MRRLSDEVFTVGMKTLFLAIILHGCMTSGCGYNPDCFDGCPPEEPTIVEHTTEVTKTVTVVGQPGPAGQRGLPGEAGPAGQDGRDAEPISLPPHTITDIIPLCGGPEVVLGTEDGTLIGHYSDGKRQYTTVLTPGEYEATDGEGCRFSVDEENNLTWEE